MFSYLSFGVALKHFNCSSFDGKQEEVCLSYQVSAVMTLSSENRAASFDQVVKQSEVHPLYFFLSVTEF